MKKPKLIAQWRKAWRLYSVQAMALAGVVQTTYMGLPDKLQDSLPAHWVQVITVALMVGGILGRVVQQDAQG